MSEVGASTIVGVFALTTVLSTVVVSARVVTRTFINPVFGIDDALIVVTLFLSLAFNASVFYAVHHGLGSNSTDPSQPDVQAVLKASLVADVLASWTFPSGKAAVACLLMRLFPGRKLRWVLWSFVVANAIFFYFAGLSMIIHCSPIKSQWDLSVPPRTCWNKTFFTFWGYMTGAVGAATDFAFALVPWFYITKLRISLRRKVIIGVTLSLGMFPFVCSILKMYFLKPYGKDATTSSIDLFLSGGSEICAINIAACIPTLPPLYFWCRSKLSRNSRPLHSVPTEGEGVDDAGPRRFGGREKITPTEMQLRSIDNLSGSVSEFRSTNGSIEERKDSMSIGTRIGKVVSNPV